MTTETFMTALEFMVQAHGDQKRDYVDEPYILHPIRVAGILSDIGLPEPVIIAALLHDVCEDTDRTGFDVEEVFGEEIADMVWHVSRRSRLEDGNRAKRKEIDRLFYASGSPESQSIKLADIIDNTHDIHRVAPREFSEIYLQEQMYLAAALTKGHPELIEWAKSNIRFSLKVLEKASA